MNMPKSSELKSRARVLLMEKHGFLALVTLAVTLCYLIMTWILNSAFPYTGGMMSLVLSLICSLLVNIIYYLVCAGQSALYLRLCRGQELKLGCLTEPFSRRPEPVAVYAVVQFLIQTAAVNASLGILAALPQMSTAGLLSFAATAIALLIVLVWIELGLSMTFFVYCDNPRQSGLQLLRESVRLMRGNKKHLLYIMLSFAGVFVLVLLSSGIGLLFAQPYLLTVQALFYLNLRKAESAAYTEGTQQGL